jgi:ABC-type protease/lipase transport system fused ATPase/permease subunit
MSNLLMLTGALFMLEVYDRNLPSRSVPTLVRCSFWLLVCMPLRA